MIDLKYHVVTVVAIFLALGIGMAIGSAFIGNDFILSEQEQLISRLEEDFESLRQKNTKNKLELENARKEIETLNRYAENIFPMYATEILNNYNLAIIETVPSVHTEQFLKSFATTGANIELIKFDSENFFKENATSDDISLEEVRADFHKIILERDYSNLTYEKYITVSGDTLETIDTVLIVSGDFEYAAYIAEQLNTPIIEKFKKSGVNVIFGEYLKSDFSYISYYNKLGINTIDNLDTVYGQTSLIMLLIEEPKMTANIGQKETAEKLIP